MTDYGTLQKAIIKKALFLALAAACLCIALNQKPAAKGVALGSLFSLIDFKLMALLLPRRLARKGRISYVLEFGFRFFLLSIPLILAIKLASLSFAATVAGLLLVKAAIYYHVFISNRLLPANTQDKVS